MISLHVPYTSLVPSTAGDETRSTCIVHTEDETSTCLFSSLEFLAWGRDQTPTCHGSKLVRLVHASTLLQAVGRAKFTTAVCLFPSPLHYAWTSATLLTRSEVYGG